MRIGLIDVDSHNFPNLALMKLSAYHKACGDTVEWHWGFNHYDRVYMSKVFDETYSPDVLSPANAAEVVRGGTGYGLDNKLSAEIEQMYPDYSLYPELTEYTSYGFLSRGCPRHCGFCIVSEKEGRHSYKVSDLSAFHTSQKNIKLLDPNILACPEHMQLLEQLAESHAWVDFTQGLDIRLITDSNIAVLNRIKTKQLHFAWDNPKEDLRPLFRHFQETTTIKLTRKKSVYVLTNFNSTHEEDLYRITVLRDMDFDPYVMIYNKPSAPKVTKQLARWCNNRRIFRIVHDFKDYMQNPA